jgi:formylglycine-generating enzyme required for sulfatase activity
MGVWPRSLSMIQHPTCLDNAQPDPCYCPYGLVEKRIAAFFISKYEVTTGQAWTFSDEDGAVRPNELPRTLRSRAMRPSPMPMSEQSWEECKTILRRMDLRLIYDDEWEYSCRAGTTTVFETGDSVQSLGDDALPIRSPSGNGELLLWRCGDDFDAPLVRLRNVDSCRSNAFGIAGMLGDGWEWCEVSPSTGTGRANNVLGTKVHNTATVVFDSNLVPSIGKRLLPGVQGLVALQPVHGGNVNLSTGRIEPRSAWRMRAPADLRSSSIRVRAARSIDP